MSPYAMVLAVVAAMILALAVAVYFRENFEVRRPPARATDGAWAPGVLTEIVRHA